jgi:hypothetical protein
MIDITSDTWLEIEGFIDEQLAASSRKLSSVTLDFNLTMYHRGIVSALTDLKSLSNKQPVSLLTSNEYS